MFKSRELSSALLLTMSGRQSPTASSNPPTSSLPEWYSQAHHPAPSLRKWTLIGENKGVDLWYSFPYRSPSPRPHPDPTQHLEMEPKRSQTEPKRTEIELFGVGRAGGLSG